MRLSVLLLLAGCATGVRSDEAPDAGKPPGAPDASTQPGIDAPPVTQPDAATPDAPPTTQPAAALLVTEVALAPTAGELVEISNPTGQTVDLSTYYLSDSGVYFRIPAGSVSVDVNDFIVKFPDGATIPPGGVVTVAIDSAANFQLTYGAAPTFSIAAGTMTPVASSGTPTLTNAGEPIVLFQWDGASDLVHDVDLVIVGVPTAANTLADKSGVALDGPDADTATTAYAQDARTIAPQASTPGSGLSTKRIAVEAGQEVQAGGNGIDGDDETSENTAMTWDSTFTAPTPGTVPTALVP